MGKNGTKPVGSALVVGGGIAGMQASLDLANAGIKVYLLEKSTAIGGKMAQLDKTFPTNDCAMCTISPRLVECSRHLNIELITNADLLSLSGEAGNFEATVRRRARYVDAEKCNGCGDCVKACPVELPHPFDEGMGPRKAIYRLYPQAIPNRFAIEKRGTAPCKDACPAGISVQGYVALIGQGRFKEALDVVRAALPFPAVCGRVCTAPCERACSRGQVDQPVMIRVLKRFISDYAEKSGGLTVTPVEKTKQERIAIVGSGPAGLTAAHDLALKGYPVTVFEALPVAGGLLATGIPAYRLPREAVRRDIDAILALGVELKLSSPVREVNDLFAQGYQAVFLAVGAQTSQKMDIVNEAAPGVLHALDFLKAVNLGEKVALGKRVAVVGGGNAAVDAARVARRLGAPEVTILYRRSRAEMPAIPSEVAEAEQEGVEILFLTAPVRVQTEGKKLAGVECVRMELGEPDASGRRRPIPITGSEFILNLDNLIVAIGQSVDRAGLPQGLAYTRWGTLQVDEATLETNLKGVFAGGDVATGPLDVVRAVGAAHKAAISIDRYLKGQDLKAQGVEPLPVVQFTQQELEEKVEQGEVILQPRAPMPLRPPAERGSTFDEVELGLSQEAAVAEAGRCLSCGLCSECKLCVSACLRGAILHEERDREEKLQVGAVVLAPGYSLYNARLSQEFGFGRYPNVVTSLQFERLLSASGPTEGHIRRPSDTTPPKKVAFLQCVGSRDQKHPYCSSVCCMYATKEAMLAREHVPGLQTDIFYMDIRAFGKGFDAYYERARNQGVQYIRCRVSSLKEVPASKNILVRYQTEEGEIREEEYDLVVLSVGMEPTKDAVALATTMGIQLRPEGFCQTSPFKPTDTSRPGVYVCGTFTEPKDIPDSVVQASGAAASVLSLLSEARGTLTQQKVYPSEVELDGVEPRVGVFVCHCGSNIASVVDVPDVVGWVKSLPNVVHAQNFIYTCSSDSLSTIAEKIREHNLNRVVVASCTPRTHEPLFQDAIREAGLNPYLFELANIRDQCSWVHRDEPDKATTKAKALIRSAVARVSLLQPLHKVSLGLSHRSLVIGGGAAGMAAALALADQGFPVTLVEREAELGGHLREMRTAVGGGDPQAYLRDMVARVRNHPQIEVLANTRVVKSSGFVGNFKTTLASTQDPTQRLVEHGVTIIATGGQESRDDQYMLGQDPRVVTMGDLEQRIAQAPQEIAKAQQVAMILCVGASQAGYCSRICCSTAMKNALKVKELNPQAQVYVLHKDIRTYGFKEALYTQAREKGVLFIRYAEETSPSLRDFGGELRLSATDPILKESLVLAPDLVVLATAIVPSPGAQELSTALKLPLSREGFFLEAHMKLRPVDFASEGVFLCGSAHYPKFIEEAITQAAAAAARASAILSKEQLEVGGAVAQVDSQKCAACLTCVRFCPYKAPFINREGVAEIQVALCQGCGICAAECPAKAIQLLHYKDAQVMAGTEALLEAVR